MELPEELGQVEDHLRAAREAGISPLFEFLDEPRGESHLMPSDASQIGREERGQVVLVGDNKDPAPGPDPLRGGR